MACGDVTSADNNMGNCSYSGKHNSHSYKAHPSYKKIINMAALTQESFIYQARLAVNFNH